MGTPSKLQRQVREWLNERIPSQYKENARPDWLITATGERCELDFYCESLRFAIEVQGRQHYEFVPHFHKSRQGFLDQQARDDFKLIVCATERVKLFLIHDAAQTEDMGAYLSWCHSPSNPQSEVLKRLKGTRFYNRWHRRTKAIERYRLALDQATDPYEIKTLSRWIRQGEEKIVDLWKANQPLIAAAIREA